MKRRTRLLLILLATLGLTGPADAQESLLFTTEPYMPYSFQEATGPVRGIGVDQIRTLMEGTDIPYRIEMMPWARAIALAETQPATCVFTAAQTPERQPLFKWIAPLAVGETILVKRSDSNIDVETLNEAQVFTVGTYRGDFTETLLQDMGFPKVDISATFDMTLTKLLGNRIDLMPMAQAVYERLRKRGTDIEEVITLSKQRMGIACNLGLSARIADLLQSRLDRMIADGTQAEIYRTYGMTPPN